MVRAGTQPLAGSTLSCVSEPEAVGWRKFYFAHPLWVLPILFLLFWSFTGTMQIQQNILKKFYGPQAQLYNNVPLGVNGIVGLFTTPVIGVLSDRWGRKPVIFFSCVSLACPPVLLWLLDLSRNAFRMKVFLVLVALQVTGSIGSVIGMCFTYIADTQPPARRAAVCGLIMAFGAGGGQILGPIFFAKIYANGESEDSTHLATLCWAMSMMLMVAMAVVIPESYPAHRRELQPRSCVNPLHGFRLLFNDEAPQTRSRFRLLFTLVLIIYGVKISMLDSLGLFSMQVYSFTVTQVSRLMSVFGCSQLFGQMSIPILLKLFSHKQAIASGCFMGLLAAALPAIPGIAGWILFPSEALLALTFISYIISVSLATQLVPAHRMGEGAATIQTAASLSGGIGPLVFGVLSTAFVQTAYPAGVLLIMTGLLLVALFMCLRLPNDETIAELRKHSTSVVVEDAQVTMQQA